MVFNGCILLQLEFRKLRKSFFSVHTEPFPDLGNILLYKF